MTVRFDKVDRFIRIYDGTRYSALFSPEKYDVINDKIRYLLKSAITYVISHNYATIKINSYEPLPIDKILTLHNVIILIKSVFDKDQNHYCYNIFLQKCSYK